MRILVTNDDGVHAPGLPPLAVALVEAGHDVFVVAPTSDRSGSGAALGKFWGDKPPPVMAVEWEEHPDIAVHAIDAPPATAVLAAALRAFGEPPDLVMSGINPGANTGHLVVHSGTVGAALTGVGLGIAGVAVSLTWGDEDAYHWDTAAAMAVAAIDWACESDGGPRLLNINVPNVAIDAILGVKEAELAPHGEVWIASADVSQGDLRLEFSGRADAAPHTDVGILQAGYVSVTPLVSVAHASLTGAADAVANTLPHLSATLTD